MKEFRELLIWQRSHTLTLSVYRATKSFPKEELFGLTSQLRRACASIPANIAEGCGRDGDAELKRFLGTADADSLSSETMELRRMLGGFIQKLKA